MTTYHAALRDETGCDFSVSLEAKSRQKAFNHLNENYPESRVLSVETQAQINKRESRSYRWNRRAIWGDSIDLY